VIPAVREVGYFADRNLHAFEEFELAARLQSKGWKLARIDMLAVNHFGHKMDSYKLLWRRIRSGYFGCTGEVLRAAVGQRHFSIVLRKLHHIRNSLTVIVWWALLLISMILPLPGRNRPALFFLLIVGPLAALVLRRHSFKLGLYSFVVWNFIAIGLVAGFLRKRKPPTKPLEAVTLSTCVGENNSSQCPDPAAVRA
jgi:hypothetical protein